MIQTIHQLEVEFANFYELLIPGLRLWISLGCSVEERSNLQPLDIRINSSKEPLCFQPDQLTVIRYKTIESGATLVFESISNTTIKNAHRIFKQFKQKEMI